MEVLSSAPPALLDAAVEELQLDPALIINPDDVEHIRTIGKGAFARVGLVKLHSTGELQAMKVVQWKQPKSQRQLKRIRAELDVLSTVPSIFTMDLHHVICSAERFCFVLPYIQGGDLYSMLRTQPGGFSIETARFWICEIALGIEALHSFGFIYRDLKPENVLIEEDGHLILCDFGLSKFLRPEPLEMPGHQAQRSFSFVGTPDYMAPEMVNGCGHDWSIDWWALGGMLYEIVLGYPPFGSSAAGSDPCSVYHNIVSGELHLPPTLPPETLSLISELLCCQPEHRLGTRGDGPQVKNHWFFDGVNWDTISCKQSTPPEKPSQACEPAMGADILGGRAGQDFGDMVERIHDGWNQSGSETEQQQLVDQTVGVLCQRIALQGSTLQRMHEQLIHLQLQQSQHQTELIAMGRMHSNPPSPKSSWSCFCDTSEINSLEDETDLLEELAANPVRLAESVLGSLDEVPEARALAHVRTSTTDEQPTVEEELHVAGLEKKVLERVCCALLTQTRQQQLQRVNVEAALATRVYEVQTLNQQIGALHDDIIGVQMDRDRLYAVLRKFEKELQITLLDSAGDNGDDNSNSSSQPQNGFLRWVHSIFRSNKDEAELQDQSNTV